MTPDEASQILRHALRVSGLTSRAVARSLQIPESTASRWLHGHVIPPATYWCAWLSACGYTLRLSRFGGPQDAPSPADGPEDGEGDPGAPEPGEGASP